MSTDLYGVRILDIDPDQRRLRLRVFVVYYDTHYKSHQPIPDDRSFFVRILCDKDALGDDISDDDRFDEGYVSRCAFRYIERFTELEHRNFPVDSFEGYSDFYYERSGAWQDEDELVQADFDVWVTDRAYLDALSVGDSWGTTAYVTRSDDLGADDYPLVPDLGDEVAVFTPFPDASDPDATVVGRMVFSADGRHLLVTHSEGGWKVFSTADWSPVAEALDVGAWNFSPGWTRDGQVAWAEDGAYVQMDIHTKVRTPLTTFGNQSDATGTRLLSHDGEVESVDILDADGSALYTTARGYDLMTYAAFDATGDRCALVIEGGPLQLIDIPAGTSRTIGEGRFNGLAMSPDGRYILASTYRDVSVIRAEDGATIRQLLPKQHAIPTAVAWSRDGRMAASSMTNSQGATSQVVIHRSGQAVADAERATLEPARGDGKDITDLAQLYVDQTNRFSSGWHSHIDDNLLDFHLSLVRMGRDSSLVEAMHEPQAPIMARAYESIIARRQGDHARADQALADALRREAAETIGEWAHTFVYAPLAAAQHLAGDADAALAMLEKARVELDKEANAYQKRAVLCRALLDMGDLDAARACIGTEKPGYIGQFHHRILSDLIDAGAHGLLNDTWELWGCTSDWETRGIVCDALVGEGQFEQALALGGLSNHHLSAIWRAWIAADALSAHTALAQNNPDPALRKLIETAPEPLKPKEGFDALCADGKWEEAYAVLNETKKTLRNPLYHTIASAARARGDIAIMLDALKALPCSDMNAPGLRALQSAFKALAGKHYRTFHP